MTSTGFQIATGRCAALTMRNRSPLPCPLILVIALCDLTAPPPGAPAAPPEGGGVRQRLSETIVNVDLDGVMFSKVIDQLRADHQLNIYVNERALAAAGVGRDTRITVRLQAVPLASALELILRDAGGGETPLTYVVENEVVVVSTGKETSERPVTRIYDATDLIDSGYAGRRFLNTPLLALKLTGAEAPGSGAEGGSAYQNPFQGGAAGGRTFERLETLLELIKETVHPDAWRDNGGTSTINQQGSRLVVSAGLRVHQDLEALLALLRGDAPKIVDLRWTLFQVEGKAIAGIEEQVGPNWPRMPAETATALERELQAEGSILMATTTTGPTGRGQLVSSLRQREYITTVQPVVDESAVAYQPAIAQANSGVELIVLPIVAHDGRSLTLDVSLAIAAPGELSEQRCAAALATRDLDRSPHEVTVQLRNATLQTVLSSVRLEPGEAVVLTIPETQGGAAAMPTRYLLLRPTLR